MQNMRLVGIILATAMLTACGSIEKRSEILVKTPLEKIVNKVSTRKLWTASSGGAGNTDAYLQAAVGKNLIVTASSRGKISAFNSTSGKLLWAANIKQVISCGPSLTRNSVYVVTANAQLVALKRNDGSVRWQVPLSSEALALPVVRDKVIYVHTLDGGLTAINMQDGRQLWRYATQSPSIMLRRSSAPVLAGDFVYTGFANGKLVAIDRLDGTVDWTYTIKKSQGRSDVQRMIDISASPVIQGKYIYTVGYHGNLVALNKSTGSMVWQKEIASISGVRIQGRTIFVADTTGTVWSIQRKNGQVNWQQPALFGRRLTNPTVSGNYLLVGDDDGILHWLDKRDGSIVSRLKISSKAIDVPVVTDKNILYVYSRDGKVTSLRILDNS